MSRNLVPHNGEKTASWRHRLSSRLLIKVALTFLFGITLPVISLASEVTYTLANSGEPTVTLSSMGGENEGGYLLEISNGHGYTQAFGSFDGVGDVRMDVWGAQRLSSSAQQRFRRYFRRTGTIDHPGFLHSNPPWRVLE